ncbi:antibiotic biosynthesis monooxygenase [Klebsiella pneumoniae]|uniref:Antibiotic biosynthesis monooxygenase n=1 Tax=Klebsiella pneumoniae TaxID=573 RepID=A0A939SS30_KLEPN|nr:antibiotic biosynthesis monooxygenase [Klebsiella pneumoniae]
MITNVLRVLLIPTPLLLHHVSPEYSQKAAFIPEMRFSSHYARQVKKIMERCFNMIDQQNSAAHTSAYIDSIAGSGYV